jgi:hypothetical protein
MPPIRYGSCGRNTAFQSIRDRFSAPFFLFFPDEDRQGLVEGHGLLEGLLDLVGDLEGNFDRSGPRSKKLISQKAT